MNAADDATKAFYATSLTDLRARLKVLIADRSHLLRSSAPALAPGKNPPLALYVSSPPCMLFSILLCLFLVTPGCLVFFVGVFVVFVGRAVFHLATMRVAYAYSGGGCCACVCMCASLAHCPTPPPPPIPSSSQGTFCPLPSPLPSPHRATSALSLFVELPRRFPPSRHRPALHASHSKPSPPRGRGGKAAVVEAATAVAAPACSSSTRTTSS